MTSSPTAERGSPIARPGLTATATVVILIALFIPGNDIPQVGFDRIDLLAHLVLFGAWGAAVQWEFAPRWWVMVLAAVGLGVGSELLQKLAVQRSFSISDMAADMVGVLLGSALVRGAPRLLEAVEERRRLR